MPSIYSKGMSNSRQKLQEYILLSHIEMAMNPGKEI